jgi:hypothetical protein
VLQPSYGGGLEDAFIAKLTPSGGSFDYVTYLGGPNNEGGEAIAVDSTWQRVYFWIATGTGLPITVGAFKTVPDQFSGANAWTAKINAFRQPT